MKGVNESMGESSEMTSWIRKLGLQKYESYKLGFMRNKYKGTKERKLSNYKPDATLKGKSLTTPQKRKNNKKSPTEKY